MRVLSGRRRTWLSSEARLRGVLDTPQDGRRLALPGRGTLRRAPLPDGSHALIRRVRRGGLLRDLLPDLFLGASRSLAELRAAERLAERGLAAPVLTVEMRGWGLVSLRVAVLEIEDSCDLLRWAGEGRPPQEQVEVARLAGRTVRGMHDSGVSHADLNAANLLLVGSGEDRRVLVVDLDKARSFPHAVPAGRREREVLRLCRSLDKWEETAATTASARAAFLSEALPPDSARRTLSRARSRSAWRTRLGRRPRASRPERLAPP